MNLTIKRVWRDIQGSPLASAVSIGATSAVVEEVVDFDENGGDFVIGVDSGTYTGFNETTKTITGLSPALTVAHPKGTFLQEGPEPRGPKYADGYIDDQDSVTESVLIPSHLRRFFSLGGREADEMEVVEVGLRGDGSLVVLDAPVDEDRADSPVPIMWSVGSGNVSVGVRPHQLAVPFSGQIEEFYMMMGDAGAPTGASIIVDILRDGVSILGAGNKLTIPAGSERSNLVIPQTKAVTKLDALQVEFEQVGSTLPGSDPTLWGTMYPSEHAIARRIEVAGPQGDPGVDGVITEVQNEGSALADQSIMNFTGDGVDVTVAGGKYVVDIAGGGGGDVTLISSQTLSTTTATVTFSSIPSTYKHLFIRIQARTNRSLTDDQLRMQFNGDTGSNYDYVDNTNDGGSNSPATGSAVTFIVAGYISGDTAPTSAAGVATIDLVNYAGTTFHKQSSGISTERINTSSNKQATSGGNWRSTSAISSVSIFAIGSFVAGSVFSLYGVS